MNQRQVYFCIGLNLLLYGLIMHNIDLQAIGALNLAVACLFIPLWESVKRLLKWLEIKYTGYDGAKRVR
jgi:hypothetical protein